MEIKASGEENGVMIAKDRPCQPELTDLLSILQGHGVQGPRQDSEDRGHQILGRHKLLTQLAAVSSQGCKGKLLEPSGMPLALEMRSGLGERPSRHSPTRLRERMLKPGSLSLEGSTSANQKSPDVRHSCHHPDSYRGRDRDAGGTVLITS